MDVNIISNDVIQLENGSYDFFEEVLIPSEEQEHYKIVGREITGDYENVIVTGDKISNRIWYTMRDSYDGVPLYGKTFKIWFKTPDGYVDSDEPCEIVHNEAKGQIRFCWLLNPKHSRIQGNINYALEISDDSGYEWNTLEATLTVKKGFDKNGEVPPIERGWVEKCIDDSSSALSTANQTAASAALFASKIQSIFASCAISNKVAGITVGMAVSGLFPLKFDSWSVSLGEKVLASALGPEDEFVTAPVIFQNEGITVTFYVGTLQIVTELEIINKHGNIQWGILKFKEFAE